MASKSVAELEVKLATVRARRKYLQQQGKNVYYHKQKELEILAELTAKRILQ